MTVYDSIPVTVTGGTLSDAEIAAYVKHSKKTYRNRKIEQLSIQVDGGINSETAALCAKAGADIMVAGSYIFKSSDMKDAVSSLADAK